MFEKNNNITQLEFARVKEGWHKKNEREVGEDGQVRRPLLFLFFQKVEKGEEHVLLRQEREKLFEEEVEEGGRKKEK